MIDRYVAELDRSLRGPRTAKADLLTEVRDALVDAAEGYEASGLDREAAERRAVTDFGPVANLAPDFQAELGLAQGRRTAALVCAVLLAQPVTWEVLERLAGHRPAGPNDRAYQLVDALTCWSGCVSVALGLLAVLAAGIGVRVLGVRREVTRLTGLFAFAVCAIFPVLGVLSTVLSPATSALSPTGLPAVAVVLGLPLLAVAASGRRCLRAT